MALRIAGMTALMAVLAFLDPPDNTFFWNALFDLGHVLLFALVAWMGIGIVRLTAPNLSNGAQTISVFVGAVILGVVTEILQRFQPTRDPSVGDALRDAVGAGASLLLLSSWVPGQSSRVCFKPWVCRASALLLLGGVAVPSFQTFSSYVERDRAFPTLIRFDGSDWERQFLSTSNSLLIPNALTSPNESCRCRLASLMMNSGRYPGIVLDEPFPDWRGYQKLVVSFLADDGASHMMTLRIHDRWHNQRYEDRFNKQILVGPGLQIATIPLEDIRRAPHGRPMDLSQIKGIVIYSAYLVQPERIYLGPIRLE